MKKIQPLAGNAAFLAIKLRTFMLVRFVRAVKNQIIWICGSWSIKWAMYKEKLSH